MSPIEFATFQVWSLFSRHDWPFPLHFVYLVYTCQCKHTIGGWMEGTNCFVKHCNDDTNCKQFFGVHSKRHCFAVATYHVHLPMWTNYFVNIATQRDYSTCTHSQWTIHTYTHITYTHVCLCIYVCLSVCLYVCLYILRVHRSRWFPTSFALGVWLYQTSVEQGSPSAQPGLAHHHCCCIQYHTDVAQRSPLSHGNKGVLLVDKDSNWSLYIYMCMLLAFSHIFSLYFLSLYPLPPSPPPSFSLPPSLPHSS